MAMDKNLGKLVEEAQKMQQRMQEAQDQLSKLTVIGEAGGGAATVEMDGRHNIIKATIKPSVLEEDPVFSAETAADLFAAAANQAVRKVEEATKAKISSLASGLNIPSELMPKDKTGDNE